jgi:hypothetical protein
MIWSTSDQMLKIGAGDFAEHAILLCNYFLYIGLNAFVLLGRGIPEGMVAYVLVQDQSNISSNELSNLDSEKNGESKIDKSSSQQYILYNPVTGDSYRIQDTHIPLNEIGFIFNSENVFCYNF